jgi:hypothetical protein
VREKRTRGQFNSKFKIQNSKFKIQNSKFKIHPYTPHPTPHSPLPTPHSLSSLLTTHSPKKRIMNFASSRTDDAMLDAKIMRFSVGQSQQN